MGNSLLTGTPVWPPGGGEMAVRTRAFDWSTTALGPIEAWPQCLKTTVDLMLSAGHAMMLAWGPEKIVLYNDAYAPMLGTRHPAALGRPLHEAWPEIWSDIEPLVARAFAGETVRVKEMPLVTTRHRYREDTWWDFSFSPIRDELGTVAGLLNVTVDAVPGVRAKRAEAALHESAERLQLAMDIGELASWDWDLRSGAVTWNDRHYLMQGYAIGEVTPSFKAWLARVHPEDRAQAMAKIGQARDGRQPYLHDFRTLRPDGTVCWCSARGSFLYDRAGKPYRMIGLMDDVTERKRMEQALRDNAARQAFLLALGDAMRGQSSANGVIEVATRLLGEHMSAAGVLLAEYDHEGGLAHIFNGWFADGARPFPTLMRLADFEGPILQDLRAGRTVRVDDARDPALARSDLAAISELGVAALLIVPLVVRGRLLVNISLHQHSGRHWTDEDAALVQEVAERIWADLVRSRAELALRASEKRYRELFERIDEGFCIIEMTFDGDRAVDYTFIEVNPAFERHTGIAAAAGRRMREIAREHEEHWFQIYGEIALTGKSMRFAAPASQLGDRYYDVHAFRIGKPKQRRVAILFRDITQRQRDTAALRDSEARLRGFGEASQDVLWIRDAATLGWTYLTPAFEAIYGVSRKEALAGDNFRNWTDMILPEDREAAIANIQKVREGERVTFEYRIRRPLDGQIRWLRNTDFPILDENGRVESIGGIGIDVTEQKETAERMNVLVAELQHRTRNLIGVVQAVADRTVRSAGSLQEFRDSFRARLGALARVNGLLSRLNGADRITFDELIRAELSGHGVLEGNGHGAQVTLEGPAGIRLRSSTVQTFALALHELATNAIKYGALSSAEGHLSVTWQVIEDGEARLRVEWLEAGVAMTPDKDDAVRTGYGRELIERALPYQLQAETTYEFRPDGVRCTITLPVSSRHGKAKDG